MWKTWVLSQSCSSAWHENRTKASKQYGMLIYSCDRYLREIIFKKESFVWVQDFINSSPWSQTVMRGNILIKHTEDQLHIWWPGSISVLVGFFPPSPSYEGVAHIQNGHSLLTISESTHIGHALKYVFLISHVPPNQICLAIKIHNCQWDFLLLFAFIVFDLFPEEFGILSNIIKMKEVYVLSKCLQLRDLC